MTSRRNFLQAVATGALLPALPAGAARAPRNAAESSGGSYFPNVRLHTHDGRQVRFYDDLIHGKTVMINMVYSVCTNICPPSTATLLEVQRALGPLVGREVFMYSLTLQPEFDTPAALADYARRYGVGSGWTFLTGKRADIDLIRRKLGFFDPDPAIDNDPKQHTGMVRLGSDRLNRWSMVPSLGTPRQIVRSVLNYM